jgi:predicted dehydrogenase
MTARIAIVGTGAFAATHAQAIAETPGVTLSACCDTDLRKAKGFSVQWGGASVDSIDTLLKTKPQIVVIATPDDTHATVLKDILTTEAVPPVIVVEKPLCVSSAELKKLKTLVAASTCTVIVEHSRRFNAGFRGLRSAIEAGTYGTLRSLHWKYYAGWFHTGVHAVDTIRMLIGECSVKSAIMTGKGRDNKDPLLSVELQSKIFPQATVTLEGVSENPYAIFEAEIVLSSGRIRNHWEDIFVDTVSPGTYGPVLRFGSHSTAEPVTAALKTMYTEVLRLLSGGKSEMLHSTDFAAACGTMDILFAAQAKAKK